MLSSSGESSFEKKILQACTIGDLQTLQQCFSELDIGTRHPLICYSQNHHLRDSEPPTIQQMLEAAVCGKEANILSYLLSTFPTASIDRNLILFAI